MGYACPVCETPQRDGEHLANHLAFSALVGDADHEAWLDEHVPGWGDERPESLAPKVTAHASETAYDEVFEDTVESGHDHRYDHDHESLFDDADAAGGRDGPDVEVHAGADHAGGDLGPEAREILQEAQALTTEMVEDAVRTVEERADPERETTAGPERETTAGSDDAGERAQADDAGGTDGKES